MIDYRIDFDSQVNFNKIKKFGDLVDRLVDFCDWVENVDTPTLFWNSTNFLVKANSYYVKNYFSFSGHEKNELKDLISSSREMLNDKMKYMSFQDYLKRDK